MRVLHVLVTGAWLAVALLQLPAALAMRGRPGVALGFLGCSALLAAGAVADETQLLVAGSVLGAAAPLWVGLTRPGGPRWGHHLLRAGALLGLLMLSTWA